MNKVYLVIIIVLSLVFTSCEKESIQTSVKDLNESELVDVLRLMFLEENGGMQYVRVFTSKMVVDTILECKENRNYSFTENNPTFTLNYNLNFNFNCSLNSVPELTYPYHNNFHVKNGQVMVTKDQWHINGKYDGNVTYALKSDKKSAAYSQYYFSSFKISNKDIGVSASGGINIVSNLCSYDLDNFIVSSKNKYNVSMGLTDQGTGSQSSNLEGVIVINSNNEWIFTSETTNISYTL
ncbi:MAG: hypothetical protein U0T36_00165 [Saprospiraceae bacterium]|jgi:hypothetical protein